MGFWGERAGNEEIFGSFFGIGRGLEWLEGEEGEGEWRVRSMSCGCC